MPVDVSKLHFRLAHEPDVAWIIALWKAIHGGDPGPEQVALQVIAALSSYLAKPAAELSIEEYQEKFQSLGVKMSRTSGEAEHTEERRVAPPGFREYCFQFQGKTLCVFIPIHRLQQVQEIPV